MLSGEGVDNSYFCGFWHSICSTKEAALEKGSEANVICWWMTGQSSGRETERGQLPGDGEGEDSLSLQRNLGKKQKAVKMLRLLLVKYQGGKQVSGKPH